MAATFPASALAAEDSTLLFLPDREFLELCQRNWKVAFAVIRSLAWRHAQDNLKGVLAQESE